MSKNEKTKLELDAMDREHTLSALESYEWDIEKTAEALEIPIKKMYEKLNSYGLAYRYVAEKEVSK